MENKNFKFTEKYKEIDFDEKKSFEMEYLNEDKIILWDDKLYLLE